MFTEFIQRSLKNYKHYFIAQLKLFLVMALIFIVGLGIIQVPHAIGIGLGIAIFDLLPLLGSGLIFIPWAVYAMVSHQGNLAWRLALIYILAFIIKQFLEPFLIGKNLSLPFYVPIIITIICSSLFNIFGLLLAAIIIPIITSVYEMYLLHKKSGQSSHNIGS